MGYPAGGRQADAQHARRIAWLVIGALPFVLLIVETWYLWIHWSPLPPDAFTYLAAGERLNAGHSLYGPLGPHDRALPFVSLYAAPILSPPLIAVAWRPLAMLGSWTVYPWWAITAGALLGTVALLWSKAPLVTGALALVAVYPLAIQLGAANLNSIVLAGAVGVWLLWRHGRIGTAMGVAVALSAVKVLPVLLVLWLLAVAPRQSWRPFVAATMALAAVSVLGAGIGAHVSYLSVLASTAEGGTRLPLVVGACAIAVPISRRRPDIAYAFAIAAMAVAWASVLLIALAALAAFPMQRAARAVSLTGVDGRIGRPALARRPEAAPPA